MKVRLINSINYMIMDQFNLDKSLQDTITCLKRLYEGEIVCENGMVNMYVRSVKGVNNG